MTIMMESQKDEVNKWEKLFEVQKETMSKLFQQTNTQKNKLLHIEESEEKLRKKLDQSTKDNG